MNYRLTFTIVSTLAVLVVLAGSLHWRASTALPDPVARPASHPMERKNSKSRQVLEAKKSAILESPLISEKGKAKLIAYLEGRKRAKTPFDQPDKAAQFFLDERRPIDGREIPFENYIRFRDRFRDKADIRGVVPALGGKRKGFSKATGVDTNGNALFAESLAADDHTWQNIGPGNIGGRTRALLVQNTVPHTLYAGGVSGGVWKSVDGGGSWTVLNDLLPSLAISKIVQHPDDPDTIYAATGEAWLPITRGAGIFKTTNGGQAWAQLAGTAENEDFYFVSGFAFSPNTPGKIYVTTRTGVFASEDDGVTWSTLPVFRFSTGGFNELAVVDGGGVDYIYAWNVCGGLDVSHDAGATFSKIIGGSGFDCNFRRGAIGVSPSNPAIAYVSVANLAGRSAGVYKTTDFFATDPVIISVGDNSLSGRLNAAILSGSNWQFDTGDGTNCDGAPFDDGGQGWYDNVVAVDPTNPDVVWVGGVDLWRSDDGGVSFQSASRWYLQLNVGIGGAIHADHHAIVFSPTYDGVSDTTIYFGNDGGIYKTTDALGATSTGVCSGEPLPQIVYGGLNNGYGVTQFYHGDVAGSGDVFIAGAQDNGTMIYDGPGTTTWSRIFGGDGGYSFIDPIDSTIMYLSYQFMHFLRSDNGGANSILISDGITSGGSGAFITPFTMDQTDPRRLYTANLELWRADDARTDPVVWSNLGALGGTENATALEISPNNPNILYVGTGDGKLLRIVNAPQ